MTVSSSRADWLMVVRLAENDVTAGGYVFGMRKCPWPDCCIQIFFVQESRTGKTISYPPERLDFDATDIPHPIKKAFGEAIACHSVECYVASAREGTLSMIHGAGGGFV